MAEKRKSLGRGLSALLGDAGQDYADLDKVRSTKTVPIESVHAGKYQPRHTFDDTKIEELAKSIQSNGILQPLVVRRDPGGQNEYEIIAGERRWRAAQIARLHEVPVIIKDISDQTALEIALVENIQREDLNDIDEALAYRRLIDEFGHTQDDLASAVGKSRSHVANTLRLLSLPDAVRAMVAQGRLSAGHARALVGQDKAEKLANDIINRNLTVRDAERLVKKETTTAGPAKAPRSQPDPDTKSLEQDLERLVGLRVKLATKGGGGTLTISFDTLDQLDGLLERLSAAPPGKQTANAALTRPSAEPSADAKKKGGVTPGPIASPPPQQAAANTPRSGMPPIPPPPGARAATNPGATPGPGPKPEPGPQQPPKQPQPASKPTLPLESRAPQQNQAPRTPTPAKAGSLPPVPAPPGSGPKPAPLATPPNSGPNQKTPTPTGTETRTVPEPKPKLAPKPAQPKPADQPDRNADPYAALTGAAGAAGGAPAPARREKDDKATAEGAGGDTGGWVTDTGPPPSDDD